MAGLRFKTFSKGHAVYYYSYTKHPTIQSYFSKCNIDAFEREGLLRQLFKLGCIHTYASLNVRTGLIIYQAKGQYSVSADKIEIRTDLQLSNKLMIETN
jgi:hypothetical protein